MIYTRNKSESSQYYKSLRYLFYPLLILSLVGCAQNDYSDLRMYVSEVKAREPGSIEPLPEIKTVDPYIFQSAGLRNPFEPSKNPEEPVQVIVSNGIHPDTMRAREELESYSLDSLRMVGTVNMQSILWALIKASDGTVHRVREGHYMGRNYGKVIRVVEDKLELIEIVPDGQPGLWREKQASVALAAKGGKKS